ncbi:MAG TPA: diadenylate cyclase CdaA [Bacteroidales bacterium]
MSFFFVDIHLVDLIDILLVAVLLFTLYKLLKGTVAINISLGLASLFILWKVVNAMQMELLSQILGAFISVGLVALIIIFQPEIRQFLLTLGTTRFFNRNSRFSFVRSFFAETIEFDVDAVVAACKKMSETKEGALIVITRQNELLQYINTGQELNAIISAHLIENIFFKNSPLHDGAMIISHNYIKAAACILPVTKRKIEGNVGLRHRAAIGITEISDAIAIVVSEETGMISYCLKGELEYDIQPRNLQEKLISDLELQ